MRKAIMVEGGAAEANEADVIDANIDFHLNAGVDFVVATDHRSADGTREILESSASQGVLHLVREDGDVRGDLITPMARMAARDFGADWVINADADEFYWPRGGSGIGWAIWALSQSMTRGPCCNTPKPFAMTAGSRRSAGDATR